MTAVSHNQAQVTSLLNYHRQEAAEHIGKMKDALARKSMTDMARAVRGFRSHAKDLRAEIASLMPELDAADAWVERERTSLAGELETILKAKGVIAK